jgi:hypothetical protein
LLQKSNPEWDKNVADQPIPSASSNIEEDALELFLRKNDANENDRTVQEVLIHRIIDGFDSIQRLGHDTDILQWWKSVKELHPQLFQLSEVILAVPATQVSVERGFSSLKLILSPLRRILDPKLSKDILLVKCNKLFEQ